jgi:GT2 family glycosyltransferase
MKERLTRNEADGRPLVSVVVLSYDRPALLAEALDAVLAQDYANTDITVVDNPSPSSAQVAALVNLRPGVRLVANSANEGYAGGMNRGIERARGEYVLLTEDDIVLAHDCVARLVEHAEAHASVGLSAPVIYNRGEGTIRCAGAEIELGGVFKKKVYGAGERDEGQFGDSFEVPYLDGATLFGRADFLRALGGFREEFFMYVEADELCARVVKAGARLAVVPGSKVYHFEPPTDAPPAPGLAFHKLKNFFALYLLHAPARVLPEFFCRYALLAALRSLVGRGADPLTHLKALLWVMKRAPALVVDRRGLGERMKTG